INRAELLQVLNLPGDARPVDFVRSNRQAQRGDFPEPNQYNPERADQLLHQAGWTRRSRKGPLVRGGERFRFKAFVLESLSGLPEAAVYVQDQFKRIGVDMDLIMISDASFVESRIRAGTFEAVFGGLGEWQLGETIRATGYDNPSFFTLLERMGRSFDPE